MTNEPSPRPWQVIRALGIDEEVESVFVADAHNSAIARMVAYAENDESNAALIVDAVNFYDATVDTQLTALLAERDRLRDIVKRFADYAETYHSLGVQGKSLVAEARTAIKENEQC